MSGNNQKCISSINQLKYFLGPLEVMTKVNQWLPLYQRSLFLCQKQQFSKHQFGFLPLLQKIDINCRENGISTMTANPSDIVRPPLTNPFFFFLFIICPSPIANFKRRMHSWIWMNPSLLLWCYFFSCMCRGDGNSWILCIVYL